MFMTYGLCHTRQGSKGHDLTAYLEGIITGIFDCFIQFFSCYKCFEGSLDAFFSVIVEKTPPSTPFSGILNGNMIKKDFLYDFFTPPSPYPETSAVN